MNGIFKRNSGIMEASMPAGATWDWTVDMTEELTETSDTITGVAWSLQNGLTSGIIVNTGYKSSIFITAPNTPSNTPYLCTVVFTTAGGRVTPRAFMMYILNPLEFN